MARGNGSEQDGWRWCFFMRQCEMDKMEECWRANQSWAFTEVSHSNANRPSQLESFEGSRAFTAAKKPLCIYPHLTVWLYDSCFRSLNSLRESSIWHVFTVEGLDIELDTNFAKRVSFFWVNNPIELVCRLQNTEGVPLSLYKTESSSELVS